ncbi:MAG: hypothetical protein JO063_01860 [Pseudonocardiales bacterium]|nr:hypothetical protein [Pseudonocardiales bacterium]
MPTRPPRPDADLLARTVEWLDGRPHVERTFVRSVWERLAELERCGCPTGPIDALRSILLDHQPTTRAGRCHGCRSLTWCHRVVWRFHLIPVPRCRRFPCLVWSRIGVELLEHPAERGRHRRAADGDRKRARPPPRRAGDHQSSRPTGPGGSPRRTEADPWRADTPDAGASPGGAAAEATRRATGRDHAWPGSPTRGR